MLVTIATHNGSDVKIEHNVRNPKTILKENHIDPDGHHEVWRHEKLREAYERIFGDAVKRYNEKQKRDDRKIKSYFNKIKDDAKKHVCYEMIVGVYSADKIVGPSEVMQHDILKEFVDGWQKRNPNLELIGAYYHADEQGEPHVHVDYVPVAHGFQRGMEKQNGLVRALGEMGFQKQGKETAQIQWQRRENQELERICKDYGLEVTHPKEEKRQHIETELFKMEKRLEQLINESKELLDINDELTIKRDQLNRQVEKALKRLEKDFERSYKYNRDKRAYEYDTDLEKQIRSLVKDVRSEMEEMKSFDDDIEVQHELARRNNQQAEEHLKTAKMLEDRQKELILDEATKIADRQLNEFLATNFEKKKDRSGRNIRLEDYCNTLQLKNGQTVLQEFNKMENERLEKARDLWSQSR